ncbi:MAG: discoidin domain-containing protein [Acidovorax sp.]|nr:discoidin domain-containing protein [Acidovorax sp.]
MFAATRTGVLTAKANGAYRYWAVLVLNNNGDTGFISCSEVELRSVVGGADLTSPSTPVTVTSGTLFPASNTVDNNLGTYFLTGSGQVTNQRFAFDLVTPQKVVQMGWRKRGTGLASQAPKDLTIQASADGATWDTVASFTNSTGWDDFLRLFTW